MPFFKNRQSININYRVINEETNYFPVVLIHGYGSSMQIFAKQVPFLKKYFKIILFDAAGHGESEKSKSEEDLIKKTAQDLEELLNKLEIDSKIGILTHSLFGSCVAQDFISEYQNRIEFVIFLNGGTLRLENNICYIFWNLLPKFTRMHFKEIAQISLDLLIDRTMPFIEKAIIPEGTEFSEEEIESLEEKIKSDISEMLESNYFSYNISCPCLIIGAELDDFAPDYMSKQLYDNIEGSELYIVKMTGHYGLSQIPHEYNELIFTFLRKINIIKISKHLDE